MPILLQDLHRQLLVHQIVLREEDVERDVVWCGHGRDGVGFERGDERGGEVLCGGGGGYLGGDAVVEAPFDCGGRRLE